jgi:hypothetical protein
MQWLEYTVDVRAARISCKGFDMTRDAEISSETKNKFNNLIAMRTDVVSFGKSLPALYTAECQSLPEMNATAEWLYGMMLSSESVLSFSYNACVGLVLERLLLDTSFRSQ